MTDSAPAPDRPNAEPSGPRGSNQTRVRDWNERLVLTLLRGQGALSKAEIARQTGLSAQTVSVIMRALEADGMLERGEPVRGKVGQPSVPMSLVAEGAFFLGLKIGRRSSEMVLVDFHGALRGRRLRRHDWPMPDEAIAFVEARIDAGDRLTCAPGWRAWAWRLRFACGTGPRPWARHRSRWTSGAGVT